MLQVIFNSSSNFTSMVTSQPHPFLVSLMIISKNFRCLSCRASQDPGWKGFNDPQCAGFHASRWGRGEANVGGPGTVIEIPQKLWRFRSPVHEWRNICAQRVPRDVRTDVLRCRASGTRKHTWRSCYWTARNRYAALIRFENHAHTRFVDGQEHLISPSMYSLCAC